MSSALNGSYMLEPFEHSSAIKICNGIMFDFYLGLPHAFLHVHVHCYLNLHLSNPKIMISIDICCALNGNCSAVYTNSNVSLIQLPEHLNIP